MTHTGPSTGDPPQGNPHKGHPTREPTGDSIHGNHSGNPQEDPNRGLPQENPHSGPPTRDPYRGPSRADPRKGTPTADPPHGNPTQDSTGDHLQGTHHRAPTTGHPCTDPLQGTPYRGPRTWKQLQGTCCMVSTLRDRSVVPSSGQYQGTHPGEPSRERLLGHPPLHPRRSLPGDTIQ
jgi:hypothetical protein